MHSCAMSTSAKNGPGFNQLHEFRSSICRYGWTAVTWNGYRRPACSKSLLHHRQSSDIKFYVDAAAELDTRLIDNVRWSVNTAFTQPALPTPGIPVALLIPSVTISRMDIMQRTERSTATTMQAIDLGAFGPKTCNRNLQACIMSLRNCSKGAVGSLNKIMQHCRLKLIN